LAHDLTTGAAHLRDARARLAGMPVDAVIAGIDAFAELWRDASSPWRARARQIDSPLPYDMVAVSLEGLLESLTVERLTALVDAEGARDKAGYPLVGHIIAGNTPLIAWTSVLRALLVRSASLVKLPSSGRGGASSWAHLFFDSLRAASPVLGDCIALAEWDRGDAAGDAVLRHVDLLVAYGSDATIAALRALRAARPFVGYGHRVSMALVIPPAGPEVAAGLARDILLYDQGGCLSPHRVYVVGDSAAAEAVAGELARALCEAVVWPVPDDPARARRVREARGLAAMEGARVWSDDALRWTVILCAEPAFRLSPTHAVVDVASLAAVDGLAVALGDYRRYLQGCALAAPDPATTDRAREALRRLGVTYLCIPGRLQAPGLDWPEDGTPPLTSLLAA
jgi:hypothetical protein